MATKEQSVPITSNVLLGGDDMIPMEAAELPTTRQTELTIEELPSDALTSKTSLPFEFQELRSQLRDMCEWGFI